MFLPSSRDSRGNFEFNSNDNVAILFGGTDIVEYYGDTWILKLDDPSTETSIQSSTVSTSTSESTDETSFQNLLLFTIFILPVINVVKRKIID